MRNSKLWVGCVWTVAGVLASAMAQDVMPPRRLPALGEPVPAAAEMLPAQAAGGLKISLAADKTEVKAGDAVKLTLTFENVSKESLRVFIPIAQVADEYFQVRAAGPSVLQGGMQVRNMRAWLPGPQSFPELKPGEKRAYDFTVTGNPPTVQPGGVMFGAAGEYKIQVVYTYQGGGAEDFGGGALLEDDARPRADANFTPWRGSVVSEPIRLNVTGEVQAPAGGPRLLPRPQMQRF